MVINNRVVIGGVCKNVGETIETTLQKIEATGRCFSEYRALIYENNSTDATKSILNRYRDSHGYLIISEDLSREEIFSRTEIRSWDNQPCRMELIALARNRLLDTLSQNQLRHYDYLILIDLDLFDWDIQGIIDSFRFTNWDCISANGIIADGRYRDAYAYRDAEHPFGPELLGEYWWRTVCPRIQRQLTGSELLPVYSAFGGLAIYRLDAIRGCRYSARITPEFDKLVDRILKSKRVSREYLEAMREEQAKAGVGNGTSSGITGEHGINYLNNSGYGYPVVCEHVNFHSQMISRGCDKIYVNPGMTIIT